MKMLFALGFLLSAGTAVAQMSVPVALTPGSMSRASPLLKAERFAENFEPALVHREQARTVKAKLDALQQRTGQPPNILLLIVDDMGYGDTGAYGGGESLGAPTPLRLVGRAYGRADPGGR